MYLSSNHRLRDRGRNRGQTPICHRRCYRQNIPAGSAQWQTESSIIDANRHGKQADSPDADTQSSFGTLSDLRIRSGYPGPGWPFCRRRAVDRLRSSPAAVVAGEVVTMSQNRSQNISVANYRSGLGSASRQGRLIRHGTRGSAVRDSAVRRADRSAAVDMATFDHLRIAPSANDVYSITII